MTQPISTKPVICLTSAAALLATFTFFIALPATIYQANPGEFPVSFLNLIQFYLVPALCTLAIFIVPAVVFPVRLARLWCVAATLLAFYIWGHGIFQTHDFGAVDGRGWNPVVPTWQVYTEAVLIGLLGCIIAFLTLRAPKAIGLMMLFLTAGLVVQVYPTVRDSEWVSLSRQNRMPDAATFSAQSNALVVLMDTMASDVFEQVLESHPDLKAKFDGFTFFPDTVGAAPTTYLSMPAIHSGRTFNNDKPLSEYFDDSVANHSVFSKVAEAGYKSIAVEPIQNICPQHLTCFSTKQALRNARTEAHDSSYSILDAVIFRVAPLGLKAAVYNQGEWLLQKWNQDPRFVQRAIAHDSFMHEMADAVTIDSKEPTLKFLHLQTTHPPYIYEDGCKYAGRELPATRENFAEQVKCSLIGFGRVLDKLKALDVYNNTAIILLADHGNYGLTSTRFDGPIDFSTLVNSANPTFAIKPKASHGILNKSDTQVHIGDLGATLCDLLNVCTMEFGRSALQAGPTRERVFNDYRWLTEYWKVEKIPDLQRFEVFGPISSRDSWHRKLMPIEPGKEIRFGWGGSSSMYKFGGWGDPEEWGMWTIGNKSAITLANTLEHPLRLTINATGFVVKDPLDVTVLVNGLRLGTIHFSEPGQEKLTSFDIPTNEIDSEKIEIDFEVNDPKSPKELGISEDTRKIALGLHWFKFDVLE